MASYRLREVELPSITSPKIMPEIADSVYADRFQTFLERAAKQGIDTVVVYADREHCANMAYLTGFDPRFEEALLVCSVKGGTPVIVTGPECQPRAANARIPVSTKLYPPFGLLGQDRRQTPALLDLLSDCGIRQGARIGIAGWKYFTSLESPAPDSWIEIPGYVLDGIRTLAGANGEITNIGSILMNASDGMRAVNEIEQLAQFEFAAASVSDAMQRVISQIRPGQSEYEMLSKAMLPGIPLNSHLMLSTGERARADGLNGPSSRIAKKGDPISMAFGQWGALTARGGWIAEDAGDLPLEVQDYVEKLAGPFFETVREWYQTIGIGVVGGDIDAMVRSRLGDKFFNLILVPGHLIHLDEWMNTPIYPGSTETFRSGQAVQMDIIPATGTPYFTTNMEDGIALLDENGRAALKERYPDLHDRAEARRAYMADVIGIKLKPEVIPLSNTCGILQPFVLSPNRILVAN